MIFMITRWSLFAILMALFAVIIRKLSIKNKRVLYIVSVCFSIVTVLLTIMYPIENLLFSFPSVQSAFEYMYVGEIEKTVEGEESVMVTYKSDGSISTVYFPKTDNSYKLGEFLQFSKVYQKRIDIANITITQIKGTQDYYVNVWIPRTDEVLDVSDSENSYYQYSISETSSPNVLTISYDTVIQNLSEDYEVIIDDVIMSIDIK